MHIVIAPGSFKECLAATAVAEAIAAGVRRAAPEASLDLAPMADGGEGTVDALVSATGGHTVAVEAEDPLGRMRAARYGVLGDGQTAVVEAAAASGLHRLAANERAPLRASSFGTGQLIAHALDAGFRRIVVAIGGSATNDLGAGMAEALGIRLNDAAGGALARGGGALAKLASIDTSGRHRGLSEATVIAACDVTNPLCGPAGASRVYGPQKGASPEAVEILDAALAHAAEIVARDLGVSILDLPGAGAAGGLGGGLVAFLGARLRPGFGLVAETCGLEARIARAHLVFTGEGRLDGQTLHGKTPLGVARIARAQGVPAIALAGRLGEGYRALLDEGLVACVGVSPEGLPLDEAMARAATLIADAAEAALRDWLTSGERHAQRL